MFHHMAFNEKGNTLQAWFKSTSVSHEHERLLYEIVPFEFHLTICTSDTGSDAIDIVVLLLVLFLKSCIPPVVFLLFRVLTCAHSCMDYAVPTLGDAFQDFSLTFKVSSRTILPEWLTEHCVFFQTQARLSHCSTEKASFHEEYYILASMHIFNDCNRTNHLTGSETKRYHWSSLIEQWTFTEWEGYPIHTLTCGMVDHVSVPSTISFKRITTFYQYFVMSRIY